jgi:hypothetical protein
MTKYTIDDDGTQVLDGTQTTNTLIRIGDNVRMATGTVGERTYDDMLPLGTGQLFIVPPGVRVTFFTGTDETSVVWTEVFGT